MPNSYATHARKMAVAIWTVAVLATLPTKEAHAQWQVIDESAIRQNEIGQQSQLNQMIVEYKSMLSSIGSLQNIGLTPINNPRMQKITDFAPYVRQACPSSGDIVGTVLDAVNLSVDSVSTNIVGMQDKICQKITLLELDKYNTVVDMLNEMNSYANNLQNINSQYDSILGAVLNAAGDRDSLDNQTNTSTAMFTAAYKNVEQKLAANDAAIATLKAQQSMLGNIALKGSPSMIGTAMQGIIFYGAFSD